MTMGTIEFIKEGDKYYIVQVWKSGGTKNFGEEQRHCHEVYEKDFYEVSNKIEQIISGRPHVDQFPQSIVETKDRFDQMDQARYQLEFFNGYWVTREESKEIRKLIKQAWDNFSGGDLCCFGSFPGFSVCCLMNDQGLDYLPVY